MGKLHSLKRAIKRNPKEFILTNRFGISWSRGAMKTKRGWKGSFVASYRKLVQKTLKDMGREFKTW